MKAKRRKLKKLQAYWNFKMESQSQKCKLFLEGIKGEEF